MGILSISPWSIDTLIPKIDYNSETDTARAVIMDSVIKRYEKHEEFVHLVLSFIVDDNLNGIQLELGSEWINSLPVIKKFKLIDLVDKFL